MAKGLGKGLDAFFSAQDAEELTTETDEIVEVLITECRPNPYQPRKVFSEEAIDELKQSILEYGIIQPLIVRKSIKGYQIVVGERRFRAAQAADLKTVPAIVKDLTDEKMMELALLENLQREDLTPIEEAFAYESLIQELDLKQEELAKKLGKSRSHIANMMRLLSLPDDVLVWMNTGELSMGHGRALLGLKDKSTITSVAGKIREDGLNVRQVERLIQELNEKKKPKTKETSKRDIFIMERESVLRDRLGTAVKIHRGKRKGKIEIEFYNDDDLNRIIEVLE